MNQPRDLAHAVLEGDVSRLAQALTLVERRREGFEELLAALFRHTGQARVIGISGPPGAGKSTLIRSLIELLARPDRKVAVLAVDPSSSLTGGALLGDRVRMTSLVSRPNVFVRSLASQGASGGLSEAAWDICWMLDAGGYDPIFIETVGAGQADQDIRLLAHTTVLVEAPGLGDSIQALKAGLLEVSDVVVVNKSDRPDGAVTAARMRQTLALGTHHSRTPGWTPPVLNTNALTGEGVEELWRRISDHHAQLRRTGQWQACERERHAHMVDALVNRAWRKVLAARLPPHRRARLLEEVAGRRLDPHAAAEELLRSLLLMEPPDPEAWEVF